MMVQYILSMVICARSQLPRSTSDVSRASSIGQSTRLLEGVLSDIWGLRVQVSHLAAFFPLPPCFFLFYYIFNEGYCLFFAVSFTCQVLRNRLRIPTGYVLSVFGVTHIFPCTSSVRVFTFPSLLIETSCTIGSSLESFLPH